MALELGKGVVQLCASLEIKMYISFILWNYFRPENKPVAHADRLPCSKQLANGRILIWTMNKVP